MRKLMLILFLLLILPIGFGISLQADETDPPSDPGIEDGEDEDEGGDIEGDHPWGGEERSIALNNTNTKYNRRVTFTVDDYLRYFAFVYYGIDFLREPDFKYERPVTVYQNNSKTRSTYGAVDQIRSRR